MKTNILKRLSAVFVSSLLLFSFTPPHIHINGICAGQQ